MWWRPAWFSLKGKVGIRGQRRGAVLPHPALSTNHPADPCTTAAAVAGLKLALMIQEGRALSEEHRQGGQADVGHGILAVGSRALVREPLTAAPHDAQQAVEHLHPDLESDPTGQE